MHAEHFEISPRVADQINNARRQGRKIIAVGTTTVRAIESAVVDGQIRAQKGDTDIFIYPGYVFKSVDALITNFHLPKSTLLMLVSAFATPELMFSAYQCAIDREYRFYSYGGIKWLQTAVCMAKWLESIKILLYSLLLKGLK